MDGPKAELVVEEGREQGLIFPMRPGKVVLVGREGTFRIDDPSLSRRHCEISWDGTSYRLRDLQSRWGTFVNEARVEEIALRSGDRIRIGTHVVRVDIHTPVPSAPVAIHVKTASLPGVPVPALEVEVESPSGFGNDLPVARESEVTLLEDDDVIPSAPPTRTPDGAMLRAAPVASASSRAVPHVEMEVPEGHCRNCRRPLPPMEDCTMAAAVDDAVAAYCPACRAQYPLLGRVVANHRCIRLLGAGGMGVVYLAEHTVMGRKSAVKTLHGLASNDPVLVQRLLREATAGGRISHPNIVSVHDTGEQEGVAYVVMEYVPGENLAEALKRETRFEVKRALWFVTQVADAMAAAFLLGYIHRDIKPENILLMVGDTIKVTDFGLAKNLKDGELGGLTRTGQVLGTMVYIAPEQIASSKGSDQRADIYSLGATFYHLVAGRPPFDTREAIKLLMQIRRDEPEPLTSVVPGVPPSVAAIVHRCLRKDPAERYQTPEALLADCLQAMQTVP